MNILYIACSCSPTYGSEDKIGWNIPLESAKTNRVWVITREENRQSIRAWQRAHPEHPLRFLYADIPDVYKKLFRPPLYSLRLNLWHRRAERIARQLCREERIDLIHQITPIEFRSIGNYGRIPGVKFICGPLGGGECLPKALRAYAGKGMILESIRGAANRISRQALLWSGKLERCGYLLFANRETEDYLRPILPSGVPCAVATEIGIAAGEIQPAKNERKPDTPVCLLAAGRLAYRKGHALLLDALESLPEETEYLCRIVGEGPQMAALRKRCGSSKKLCGRVTFTGNVPYVKIGQQYAWADALVMPSIRETTGSVLLEAACNGLPAIAMNRFGAAMLVEEDCGWLYDATDRQGYVQALAEAIMECIRHPEKGREKGRAFRYRAGQYTWRVLMARYQGIYDSVCRKTVQSDRKGV